jgi:hypothetical protein
VTTGVRSETGWIEDCSGSLDRQPVNVEQMTELLKAMQEKLEMKANQLFRVLLIVIDARNLKSFDVIS